MSDALVIGNKPVNGKTDELEPRKKPAASKIKRAYSLNTCRHVSYGLLHSFPVLFLFLFLFLWILSLRDTHWIQIEGFSGAAHRSVQFLRRLFRFEEQLRVTRHNIYLNVSLRDRKS